MKTLTLEEEITVLQETRGLPVGQRCMALGYPEITLKGLEERFAVHKTAEAQNRQEMDRAYGELAERFKIHPQEARERFSIDAATGRVTDHARERSLWEQMQGTFDEVRRDRMDSMAALMRADEDSLWSSLPSRLVPAGILNNQRRVDDRARARAQAVERNLRMAFDIGILGAPNIAGITLKKVTGFVKTEALDDYMEEKIPERVLDSIEVAREAGLKNFFVAYPCLKVDQVELRQADPVVYAEIGKRWLEIDYWE